uniref:Reverse transcriptase Ty1/copia-type domain-containing protein n=1 Tax=Solanum lycopersicum TaxID=4081 RepID=A0A3Q7IHF0_SOLLC
MLAAKPNNPPNDSLCASTKDDGDPFDNSDIAFTVSIVIQFMFAPIAKYWTTLKQILRYLEGAPGLGLLYNNHGYICVDCFVDVDWLEPKLIEYLHRPLCLR